MRRLLHFAAAPLPAGLHSQSAGWRLNVNSYRDELTLKSQVYLGTSEIAARTQLPSSPADQFTVKATLTPAMRRALPTFLLARAERGRPSGMHASIGDLQFPL